jgi:hypothetical protein
MIKHTTETVEVGPLGLFFTNKNVQMSLPGHSHFGQLTLRFLTIPIGDKPKGFPAFAETYHLVQSRIQELTEKPFRDATNEQVARELFQGFDGWSHEIIDAWHCNFILTGLTLGVQGVQDRLGHASGMTNYSIERPTADSLQKHLENCDEIRSDENV